MLVELMSSLPKGEHPAPAVPLSRKACVWRGAVWGDWRLMSAKDGLLPRAGAEPFGEVWLNSTQSESSEKGG
jgi:hypothetical protein